MQKRLATGSARRLGRVLRIILMLLVVGGVALAFRQGVVPSWLNPLPAIDLAQANPWLVDWRLAALRYDSALCKRVLVAPHIEAQPIADNPLSKGCGWVNGVRMTRAGGAHASFDKISCQAAAALALWIEHEVQPLAQEILGQRVSSLQSFGTYSCRNIRGNPLWVDWRSEHATANALDIGGFNLADGKRISVAGHWRGTGNEARFLKAVHNRACRYFRVVLGPDFNEAHRDHFHFDRGPFLRCS
jgi:hypothetical protein